MKLFVFGLDGMPFEFLENEISNNMPNLRKIKENSLHGTLKSITPPITVPAWACMLSGKTPGELGIYGFRNRVKDDYKLKVITSSSLKTRLVFEILDSKNKKVIAIGIPPSYPPKPLKKGIRLSCFLTPGAESEYVYPQNVKKEIEENFDEYLFDVRGFRTDDKDWLIKEVFKLTEQRFDIVKYLTKKYEWDLFFFVEMGTDRIHHGLWRYFDKTHRLYEKGNPYEEIMYEYYSFLDRKIGEILEILPSDTWVMVVSDHGAKKMEGGIAVNELLIKHKYLKLKKYPEKPIRLEPDNIEFSKTYAYGEGGYYARIFLNVKGRDKEGIIDKKDYEKVRRELKELFENLIDNEGNPLNSKAYFPEELYPEIKGFPPDLIVILGDLTYRSVGSVGLREIYTFENDTGPDDANHSYEGLYMIKEPKNKLKGRKDADIYDIAGTILKIMGFEEENKKLNLKSII